jgi:hypothetical protein
LINSPSKFLTLSYRPFLLLLYFFFSSPSIRVELHFDSLLPDRFHLTAFLEGCKGGKNSNTFSSLFPVFQFRTRTKEKYDNDLLFFHSHVVSRERERKRREGLKAKEWEENGLCFFFFRLSILSK